MTILGIELNDVALAAVAGDAIVYCEPAFALHQPNDPSHQLLLGHKAREFCRLLPQSVQSGYFSRLSEASLPYGTAPYVTGADYAHAQLQHLWDEGSFGDSRAVFTVPPWWQAEQLGLLLGIADEIGIPVAGLVPAALAATRREYQGQQLFHIELGLDCCAVQQITQHTTAQVSTTEALTDFGYTALERAAAAYVMQRLLECSRFDASQSAADEQWVYTGLPVWLSTLKRQATVDISLERGGYEFSAQLQAHDLLEQLRQASQPLIRCLRAFAGVVDAASIALQCHAALDDFPGYLLMLADEVVATAYVLEPGAAARGAMRRAAQLPSSAKGYAVARDLPWDQPPLAAPAAVLQADAAKAPSHLVVAGRAYRLLPGTLVVGTEVAAGETGIAIAASANAISRRHFSLLVSANSVVLQEHSRFGTLLNGYPVRDSARLRAGDTVSIGQPAVELTLVCETPLRASDDGA